MNKFFNFLYHFSTTGLVRGLVSMAVGWGIGMALVAGIRQSQGLPRSDEVSLFVGSFFGFIFFLFGTGVLTDWTKWAMGKKTPLVHGAPKHRPSWWRYLSVDYNHKVIGIQYTVTGVLVLLIGGVLAIIFRLELVYPGMQFLNPDQYNTYFSAHGIIMIVSILLGVGGMLNYLVPLMIGAADMAFPRLNAFSYWVGIPSAVMLMLGIFVGGWETGWVAYPPLSTTTQLLGTQLFIFGFYLFGFSSIAGSINVLVTVFTMRAQGMSLFRMPIFVWAAISAALIQFTATQTVGISLLMVTAERLLGLGFFDPAGGGDPILYQHLFWFYSHPVVYVFVLPGLGVISELLPVFTRKPLFGYRWIALSSVAIALVGFLVWAHHMFVAGMAEDLRTIFMFTTMLVAVPTGVKFFSWVGTMWQGKITTPTPMLFVLGAISVFLIGGVTGPILGTVPTDLHLHDSYWVVGHFHATMFGGFVFPFFAALYYWFPKATGRMYNEKLGKLHFWLMTPGFWLMSLGQMRVGLMGMRRRIADYDPTLGIQFTHLLITLAGLVIAWSVLIMVYNLVSSARSGEVADINPWRSRSPEWQIPSPVPEMNYDEPFVVVGGPYDYGLQDSAYVRPLPSPGD
jgi:cytochrome c oxidase subunit 1